MVVDVIDRCNAMDHAMQEKGKGVILPPEAEEEVKITWYVRM